MKNTILIAALMCCLISASAQPIKKESKPRSWKESLQLVEKMNSRENVYTMKLDSVTMYQGDNMKVLLDYDAHFNCTWLAVYYLEDEWENEFAFEYAYDEQDRLTSMIDYDAGDKEDYYYNAQNLVEEIYYSFFNETWQMYEKIVLSYDEDKHVVLSMRYRMEGGNWVESNKQTWDYEDGLLQVTTTYIPNENGEWVGDGRTEYHYEEGFCTEEIDSFWTGYWYTISKTVYHYEAQQCYEKIEYGWNGEEWNEQYKHSYDHDASGNLLTEISYYHQSGVQDWIYRDKFEYLYDDDNNCTDYYEYFYYAYDEAWELEEVYHIGYGTPGIEYISGLSLMWDLFEFPFPISNKVEQLIMDEDGDYYSLDFHYSSTVGIDESTAGMFGVYPNPAKDFLVLETQDFASLQFQTYRISNMMGQMLLQAQIMDETQQIDVSGLAEGMYFVTVGEVTRKIVVR